MGPYNGKGIDIAWCPGCGNFAILRALKKALEELGIGPQGLVIVSGIGQAAKTPQYLRCNYFNGLHGRSLPVATAIKAVNPGLVVIAESGDGCMYGEGGNHLLHAIRRNPDITAIVHDNRVYGLTKGQASPTSPRGFVTPIQLHGLHALPLNPVTLGVALGASFVARAFCGDEEETKGIFVEAIRHKGFSFVDVLQPCVSYNKVNTYQWYKEHTFYLDPSHDPVDRLKAFEVALSEDPLPLGVIYKAPRDTFEETLEIYRRSAEPLLWRGRSWEEVREVVRRWGEGK